MELSETEQQALAFIRWLKTPCGQQALSEAQSKSTEACRQLAEARRVDPQSIREPMTC